MNNIQKINDIKYLIRENYSDKEPLNEGQKASKQCFLKYCDDIRKDLERLEKLEKAIEILKKNLIVKVDEGVKNKDVSCLVIAMETMDDNLAILYETFDEEKIKLLKEVFGNDR